MPNNNSINMNDDQSRRHHHHDRTYKKLPWFIVILAILWMLIGAWAYVTSFMCTHERYGGSDAQKVGMMLLAGVLGPLWFLILPFVQRDGYCKLK